MRRGTSNEGPGRGQWRCVAVARRLHSVSAHTDVSHDGNRNSDTCLHVEHRRPVFRPFSIDPREPDRHTDAEPTACSCQEIDAHRQSGSRCPVSDEMVSTYGSEYSGDVR